jgi:hypothetical protein
VVSQKIGDKAPGPCRFWFVLIKIHFAGGAQENNVFRRKGIQSFHQPEKLILCHLTLPRPERCVSTTVVNAAQGFYRGIKTTDYVQSGKDQIRLHDPCAAGKNNRLGRLKFLFICIGHPGSFLRPNLKHFISSFKSNISNISRHIRCDILLLLRQQNT